MQHDNQIYGLVSHEGQQSQEFRGLIGLDHAHSHAPGPPTQFFHIRSATANHG